MKNLRTEIKNVLTEHEDCNGCILYTKFDLVAIEIETLLISASSESRSINGNEESKEDLFCDKIGRICPIGVCDDRCPHHPDTRYLK